MPGRSKIAVLISGRGSNLQSLISATRQPEALAANNPTTADADIALVLSNNPEAPGLNIAKQHTIPTATLRHQQFPNRSQFDHAMHELLCENNIDIVLLAGFMRILGAEIVEQWQGRMLNIHPSLLPKYPGLNTHERALQAQDAFAGASVHYVTPQLDGGPVIIQGKVEINASDNADTLAARVLQIEHIIYPIALHWLVTDKIKLENELCYIDGTTQTQAPIWYQDQLIFPSS